MKGIHKKQNLRIAALILLGTILLIGCDAGEIPESASSQSSESLRQKLFEATGLQLSKSLCFKLNEDNNSYSVIGVVSELESDIVVPAEYDGKPVTSIERHAFAKCSSLTKINIPDSVTSIGDGAFMECGALTEIAIPTSITSIERHAFAECSSLTKINIPNSVTKIGDRAFMECGALTEVAIPTSITSIGTGVFAKCSSLTKINIPNSVTKIGDGAFMECSALTNITIPDSVTSIGLGAFLDCNPSLIVHYEGSQIPNKWDKNWNILTTTPWKTVRVELSN